MSEISEKQKSVDGELDLLDLFARMGRNINKFFSSLGNASLNAVIFLLKNWIPLTASLIVGIIFTFTLKLTLEPKYESNLVLKTNTVQAEEMISFINRLHILCLEENYQTLSEVLKVPLEKVENIINISAYWIIDRNGDGTPDFVDYRNRHNIYDTVNLRMNDRLNISVKTLSPPDLPLLRDGIIRYINSDSLFNQRNSIRNDQSLTLLNRLNYDIIQLDSLQKVKYFEETRNKVPGNASQFIFLQEQKTQLVYTEIYELFTRKQFIETQLQLYDDLVTILSDFTIPIKPYTRLRYYGFIIIPIFFVITLFGILYMKNRKAITALLK